MIKNLLNTLSTYIINNNILLFFFFYSFPLIITLKNENEIFLDHSSKQILFVRWIMMINDEILVSIHLFTLFLQYIDFTYTENNIQIYANTIWKAMINRNDASSFHFIFAR